MQLWRGGVMRILWLLQRTRSEWLAKVWRFSFGDARRSHSTRIVSCDRSKGFSVLLKLSAPSRII
ncbi:hypothetical protein [Nostoc sp. DSM 114159]